MHDLLHYLSNLTLILLPKAEEEEIDYVELTRGVQNLQLQLSSSQKDVSELLGLGSSAAPVLQPHLQSDLTQRLLARLDAVTKAKPDTSQVLFSYCKRFGRRLLTLIAMTGRRGYLRTLLHTGYQGSEYSKPYCRF